MESISLKLPEDLLATSDPCAKALGIPRAERMARTSRKLRLENICVNIEFAKIERAPDV